jgi:hypothetical protein
VDQDNKQPKPFEHREGWKPAEKGWSPNPNTSAEPGNADLSRPPQQGNQSSPQTSNED